VWPNGRPSVVPKVNGTKVKKEDYKEDLQEIRAGLDDTDVYKVCECR
jgi:hypothetical protein